MEIRIELPDVRLGVVEAGGVQVSLFDAELARRMDAVCAEKRHAFSLESLAEAEPIRAVRAMFRAWGVDPSKYRPSSEALLRRVVQGKGLYRVSNIVDIGNLGSVETAWPYGCYDAEQIEPPVVLRHGVSDERYEGIGKRVWHLEGRPVLADSHGPFGSPISDSTRSMITETARRVLFVIYAPSGAPDGAVVQAAERVRERLQTFAGATSTSSRIIASSTTSES